MRLLTFLTAIGLPTNAMVVRPSFKSCMASYVLGSDQHTPVHFDVTAPRVE